MKKNYQTTTAPRATAEAVVLPASVTLAMAELAENVREGLLALAVGAGLQVMATLMAEDVTAPPAGADRGQHRGGAGGVL